MTAIWQNDGNAWRLLSPMGFPVEAALHDIVAQAPELLPLSGSPQLAVLGREVQLGAGYADILAVEDSGRMVVVEVKLARNSEARRAVVAQVLSYAAYLHGMDYGELEVLVAGRSDPTTLDEHASSSFGYSSAEVASFRDGVRSSLVNGWFRVVLVLDDAPDDLVRLVGYLEQITEERLIVDLITVASYDVNGARVVVPRRIDTRSRELATAERTGHAESPAARPTRAPIVSGAGPFEEFIPEIADEYRVPLERLVIWAKGIESKGHARLRTSIGSGRRVLRIQVPGEESSLAAVWGERRRPGVSVHTTVLARRAPQTLVALRALLPDGQNPYLVANDITDELLAAIASAYEEAASGRLVLPSQPQPGDSQPT